MASNEDLSLSGVGGNDLSSSSGGVCLIKSLKGGIVCSYPISDDFRVSFVVRGGCFKVGGIVCSIPASDGVDELFFRKGGLLSGSLSTGSCGIRGSAQPAVSPKPVTGLDSMDMAVGFCCRGGQVAETHCELGVVDNSRQRSRARDVPAR